MRSVERRLQSARRSATRSRRLERALGAQEQAEVGAVNEPHREVDATIDVAGVVDRDHVRMLKRHDELGLAGKALAEALVDARDSGATSFRATAPFEPQVIGAVDDTHPAAADRLLDPKAEEVGANAGREVDESPPPSVGLVDPTPGLCDCSPSLRPR